MDYTKHYHLPQWEKADRIMMEDFNRMCADIEDGLNRNAEAAAGAGHILGQLLHILLP